MFFHYVKALIEKLIKLKITKRKLNKYSYEIIKNIEIISFIDKKILKKYINFILGKIEEKINIKNIKKFIKYIKKNWFNKKTDLFNYYKLINIINKNKNNNLMNKFYFSNNISESLNRKINYYIPKKAANCESFYNTIKKIFLNNLIKSDNIIRKDYKTRALILIINDLKLNDNPQWIDIIIFKEYEMKIIKSFNEDTNQENINNLYNPINDDISIDNFENIENIFDENNIKINDEDFENIQDDINNESNESNELIDYDMKDYDLEKNYTKVLNGMDNLEIKENESSLINILKNKPKKRKHDGLSPEKNLKNDCIKKVKKNYNYPKDY